MGDIVGESVSSTGAIVGESVVSIAGEGAGVNEKYVGKEASGRIHSA